MIDECEGRGAAYFGDKRLVGFAKIEECMTLCEEHRLKEEVKKEMEAEYGLETK